MYTVPGKVSKLNKHANCFFLLDTGTLQDNYITEEMAQHINAVGYPSCSCNKTVCSAFTGICRRSKGCISFSLNFYNGLTKMEETIFVFATISNIVVDLIS